MTKHEMTTLLRSVGCDENTVTAMTNAYEMGVEHERDEIAKLIEQAPALVESAQNEHGGCLICGFTPELAAKAIRARGEL
jgi:hypothetical protein